MSTRTVFIYLTNKVMSDPGVGPSGLLYSPKPRSLSMAIRRKRKAEGNQPDLPKNWEDIIVPDQYKATIDGELFLILEEIVPDTLKKVWGFASPSGLATLQQAQDIYGDGTFELVKQCLFVQCWVLVARNTVTSVTIPCAFFLLPDKSFPTYHLILSTLKVNHGIPSP